MKANEFDERSDEGEDMTAALDTARARRPARKHRRASLTNPKYEEHLSYKRYVSYVGRFLVRGLRGDLGGILNTSVSL